MIPFSFPSYFFEEISFSLLFFCALEVLFTLFLSKELFVGVPVRISECCLLQHFLQDVCGPMVGNVVTASVVTTSEDSVAAA
jgi:hypothetical protein